MKKPVIAFLILPILFLVSSCNRSKAADIETGKEKTTTVQTDSVKEPIVQTIDTADYNKRMVALSNNDTTGRWPVKTPYPLPEHCCHTTELLPYYGNLYSKRMGILGEFPRAEMLKKLQGEVAKWQAADPSVKAIPALHYIAVTAQGAPGKDNKHRMRMPFKQIDTIISWAKPINALVFVDIQVGHSTVKD